MTLAQQAPSSPRTRLVLDHTVRRHVGGRVLVGGSPGRVLTLSASGHRLLDRWLAGEAVGDEPGAGSLARRLVDAGLAHPVPDHAVHTTGDVTLVVPVKDNPRGVDRLLAATRDLPHRIVVDDGSGTPLPEATTRHAGARGPAAARNTGWREAHTELVAFLDSDTIPEPGWLDALLPLFTDPRVAAVAPRVVSAPVTDSRALSSYEADRCPLDLGRYPAAVRPMSRVSYVPSAALVVRTSALRALDGFDESLRYGEDVDLVWRLIADGHTVRYQPASAVAHQPRPDLRGWLAQRFSYGTSAAPLALRHPGHLAPAHLSPGSAAAWGLLAARHPFAALLLAAASAGQLRRRLRGTGLPSSAVVALAARGQAGGARQLADAARRAWWPLALLTRRGRLVLLAALAPTIAEAVTRRRGPRWLALRIADDLAYGAGVWAGCARHRTADPLLPAAVRR